MPIAGAESISLDPSNEVCAEGMSIPPFDGDVARGSWVGKVESGQVHSFMHVFTLSEEVDAELDRLLVESSNGEFRVIVVRELTEADGEPVSLTLHILTDVFLFGFFTDPNIQSGIFFHSHLLRVGIETPCVRE